MTANPKRKSITALKVRQWLVNWTTSNGNHTNAVPNHNIGFFSSVYLQST